MEKSHDFVKQQNGVMVTSNPFGHTFKQQNGVRLLEVAIRLLNIRTGLCGFIQIHTVYSGASMEEGLGFFT
jgi:hypothetical protein